MVFNLTATGTPTYTAGKYGNAVNTASGRLSYLGTGLTFTTGTIELWAKSSASPGIMIMFGNNGAPNIWFGVNGSGYVASNLGTAASASILDGAWHHIAWVFDGTNLKQWVDGALTSTTGRTTALTFDSTVATSIGQFGDGASGSFPWNGQIDEFRISNIARYTTTFTPPTTAFTTDANTLALYHLESDGTDSSAAAPADTTAPSVPTGLTVTPGNAQTAVSWTASTDNIAVTGYRVYRGGTLVASPTGTSYTDTGLTNGTTYSYTVAAIDAAGNLSAQSSAVTATPTSGATAPGPPTSLAAVPGTGSAALSWTAPTSNGGAAITDYLVEYQPSGGSWTTFADGVSTATTATVTGLINGTAYSFRVSAINSAGTSVPSGTATATPAAAAGITPNDTNIVYSPYNWLITSTVATTTTPGAYFRTTIQGTATTIAANFDLTNVTGTLPELAIRIDQQPFFTTNIAASINIPVPSTSDSWTKHTIEVVFKQDSQYDNRWNLPLVGVVKFTGFTTTPGTCATTTTRRRPYNVLACGDSITEGINTLSSGAGDSRVSWAFPLRDLLGAEIGVVGYGGSGLSGSGNGNVPVWTSVYNQLWNGQARSLTTPTEPNLILINLGTNGLVQANATTMLNGIIAATTNTKIAVVQQWNGTANAAAWQAAIAAATVPSRITYVDTTGWFNSTDASDGVHPFGYANTSDLAPRLAAAVLPLIAGAGTPVSPRRFVNVGGTAKAVA